MRVRKYKRIIALIMCTILLSLDGFSAFANETFDSTYSTNGEVVSDTNDAGDAGISVEDSEEVESNTETSENSDKEDVSKDLTSDDSDNVCGDNESESSETESESDTTHGEDESADSDGDADDTTDSSLNDTNVDNSNENSGDENITDDSSNEDEKLDEDDKDSESDLDSSEDEDEKNSDDAISDTEQVQDELLVEDFVEDSTIIELSKEVEGVLITMTGDATSFDSDKEYSLEVTLVDNDSISNAIDGVAEEKDMVVQKYQAFDIKLLADGIETQPSGSVQVKFSSADVIDSINSEDTEVEVYHVDDAGEAVDMEESQSEDGVSVETTHFSIYVVVNMNQLGGNIDVTVQHWTNLTELSNVDGSDGMVEKDSYDGTAFNTMASLNTVTTFREIYSEDVITIDNRLTKSVEDLSKVCLSNSNKSIKNYELYEVWFLKDGKSANSTTRSDWDIYSATDDETIKLSKNTTIRLVYNPVATANSLIQDVTFYDYNVSNGTVSSGNKINTADKGINSASNYSGGTTTNRIAVGMYTTGILHSYNSAVAKNGSYVNRGYYSDNGGGLERMVIGVNSNGPIYNGLYDAGLFNDSVKTGKKVFKNFDLVFNQLGDTYTLSGVNKDGTAVMSGLDVFSEVYDNGSRHIFSNNFFPMDYCGSYSGRDPFMGDKNNLIYNHNGGNLSTSDDFKAHNWFFGMRYDFEFTIGDYTGPLYYYFRGDDDFWLFVDGELVTDIGGIHSSIGKTANLEYLREQDKDKIHSVTIIYAERGGYGSCCYMQFTLPNIRAVSFPMDMEKTTLTVTKEWDDGNNPYRPSSAQFQLMYKTNEETEYHNYNEPITITEPSWQYTWSGMPKHGYSYKVVEVNTADGYEASYENDGALKYDDGVYTGKVKNTLVDKTKVKVTKVWDDNDNSADSRPEEVDFQLLCRYQGDTEWSAYPGNGAIVTLDGTIDTTETKAWYAEFNSLPRMHGGVLLEYTVREMDGTTAIENGTRWNSVGDWLYEASYIENKNGYPTTQTDVANEVTITNELICAKLTITKRIDEMDLSRGNSTFWFLITGENGYNKEVKISFSDGDESLAGFSKSGKSVTVTALAAGDYKVMELPSRGYELVDAGLDGSLIPSTDNERLPFSTKVSCTLELEKTEDVYFWNAMKTEPVYTINNTIRFDDDGNIKLENTKDEVKNGGAK